MSWASRTGSHRAWPLRTFLNKPDKRKKVVVVVVCGVGGCAAMLDKRGVRPGGESHTNVVMMRAFLDVA